MPELEVEVRHRVGTFLLDARFRSAGGVTALFGPSGSGKTTLARIVAGLVRPDAGVVRLDGATLLDTGRRISVPAYRRQVGFVFQDARLFPHLTVRQNLRYALRFGRAKAAADFERIVTLLDLSGLIDRHPAGLSGGERQRVAIGRALLAAPRLLAMDEPLASIDRVRKLEIMGYIERLRDELDLPILYISHDASEVARLAGRVVLVAAGRTVAEGPAAEMLARIDLPSYAGGTGAGSLWTARILRHETAYGLTLLDCPSGTLWVPALDRAVGAAVSVWIAAEDVMLATERPAGVSALNIVECSVAAIAEQGAAAAIIRLDCAGMPLLARITRLSAERLSLTPGSPIFASIKAIALDPHNVNAAAPAAAASFSEGPYNDPAFDGTRAKD